MPFETVTEIKRPRHRTFVLSAAAQGQLDDVVAVAGLTPSAVLEHLLDELTKYGSHRINWRKS